VRSQDDAQQIMSHEIKSHSDAASTFNELYSQYGKSRCSTVFAYGRSKIHQLLFESVKTLPTAAKILDVGAGTGEQTYLLKQRGFTVYALEPARKMRTIAKKRNPDTPILGGSVLDMPFRDNTFDMILAIEVLRYLHPNHQAKSLSQIHRILKPSGIFFATLVSKYSLDDVAYYRFKRLKNRLSHSSQLYSHFTTPALYTQSLLQHGFNDIQWHAKMSTLLRVVYILNRRIGEFLAPKFEKLEDRILKKKFISLFCGHLVFTAKAKKDKIKI
jgi:ubiquinone/menaquinone biosynthesis C-methylase UbiE